LLSTFFPLAGDHSCQFINGQPADALLPRGCKRSCKLL